MAQAKRGAGSAVTDDDQTQGADATDTGASGQEAAGVKADGVSGDAETTNVAAQTDAAEQTDESADADGDDGWRPPAPHEPLSGVIAMLEALSRQAERGQDWDSFTKLHNFSGALSVLKRRALELGDFKVDGQLAEFVEGCKLLARDVL